MRCLGTGAKRHLTTPLSSRTALSYLSPCYCYILAPVPRHLTTPLSSRTALSYLSPSYCYILAPVPRHLTTHLSSRTALSYRSPRLLTSTDQKQQTRSGGSEPIHTSILHEHRRLQSHYLQRKPALGREKQTQGIVCAA